VQLNGEDFRVFLEIGIRRKNGPLARHGEDGLYWRLEVIVISDLTFPFIRDFRTMRSFVERGLQYLAQQNANEARKRQVEQRHQQQTQQMDQRHTQQQQRMQERQQTPRQNVPPKPPQQKP
jgi:hypothetical protein